MSTHRKLGKPTDQRMAMLRAMTTYLLEEGQITTTVTRAKEVAPLAEKMITLAKKNDLAAYRQALSFLTKEDVAKKLFDRLRAPGNVCAPLVLFVLPKRTSAAPGVNRKNACAQLNVQQPMARLDKESVPAGVHLPLPALIDRRPKPGLTNRWRRCR